MQSIDEKDKRIKQLENENKKLQEEINWLEHNVEALTQVVLQASKQRFGVSSEKTPLTEEQGSLFGEDDSDNFPLPYAPVIHIKAHQRPVCKKGDREKLTQGLARETVECVLNPKESVCGICDSELKIIGKEKVRSKMEYIPAKLVMKDYVQYVYKCVECGKTDDNPYDTIVSAPVPACCTDTFHRISLQRKLDHVSEICTLGTVIQSGKRISKNGCSVSANLKCPKADGIA